jgi:hypothetical protein
MVAAGYANTSPRRLNPGARAIEERSVRAEQQPNGSLLVRESPLRLRLILTFLGVALVAGVWLQDPRDQTRLPLGGLCAMLPLLAAGLLEQVRFEFDVAQQRLRWRRHRLFRRRAGELAFDQISEVAVRVRHERDSDSRIARPAWYVALVTSSGELRLSNRMYADESGPAGVASAIGQAIGKSPRAAAAETVEQLAAAGEVIEAIKLARQERGLGLAEAKQVVDRLRAASR